MDAADAAITAPIAGFEALLGVCRKRQASVAEAHADVRAFLETAAIRVASIDVAEADAALDAFAHHGKGRCHPVQRNPGDCFACAMARTRGVALLFKGDDFSKTDVRPAIASAARSDGSTSDQQNDQHDQQDGAESAADIGAAIVEAAATKHNHQDDNQQNQVHNVPPPSRPLWRVCP